MAVVPLAYQVEREKWEDCPICHAARGWQYDRQACSACGFDRLAPEVAKALEPSKKGSAPAEG